MTKKLMSVLLAVAMCLSLAVPAVAAETTTDNYEEIVVFSVPVPEDGIQTVNALSNEDRIQQAKEGVLALGLSEMGLGYIEEACLSELTTYAEDDSIILEEYTVLIPKTRATDPVFFKRYRRYDFYCAITSKASYLVEKENFAQSAKLLDWSLAAANLAMCFSSSPALSISWTLLTSLSTLMPEDYTVHTGDRLDCFARAYPQNRAFYIKDGSAYIHVFNREFGDVQPYNVYHFSQPINGKLTEEISFSTVQYPDINSGNCDSWLDLICGYYEGNMYPSGLALSSLINFKWL